MKNSLVLGKKTCNAVLWRSISIALRTVIALTYKIEADGSWQAGEIMVLVFFVGQTVCCGCVLCTLLEEKTPKFFLLPLVFIMHTLLLCA
jgi:hypothetical protein